MDGVVEGTGRGVVAAGHAATAEAARQILDAGGNAFDAAVAAVLAACVAEPVLASLGGGGFLLARPAERKPRLYDFFTQTPKVFRPAEQTDFRPILADFGTATQEFHCGLGAMATPGVVGGLFQAQADLGRMPLREVAAPAVALAKQGLPLNAQQAYISTIVAPILRQTADCRALFCRSDGQTLLGEGDVFRTPDFAGALDALAYEGADLFYRGEIGQVLAAESAARGGHLTLDDLRGYTVALRVPLERTYRGVRLYTNPPPSTGGVLIALALEMLQSARPGDHAWGGADHLGLLAKVMELTNEARLEAGGDGLLAPDLVALYQAKVAAHPPARRGTTHVSVIDAAGNAASVSVSNGEGCGFVIPGTGIVMNNMLGEEDINPDGWHNWPRDTRMASMMAPSLVLAPDGTEVALGSGGSNRIRGAILQVLVNLLDFGLPLAEAVEHPRLHVEGTGRAARLARELDLPDALRGDWPEAAVWEARNMFFGGVHAVRRTASGGLEGAGDPRRDGVAVLA